MEIIFHFIACSFLPAVELKIEPRVEHFLKNEP